MYSIGSSYLIRQAPGAEKFGGLTIKLEPRQGNAGTLEVLLTDWRTGVRIEDDVSILTDAAMCGIEEFALEHSIDLNDYDLTLSDLAYHVVDSTTLTFKIAGYNAFASAWELWRSVTKRQAD